MNEWRGGLAPMGGCVLLTCGTLAASQNSWGEVHVELSSLLVNRDVVDLDSGPCTNGQRDQVG